MIYILEGEQRNRRESGYNNNMKKGFCNSFLVRSIRMSISVSVVKESEPI
jgi:hypothetical protein